MKKTILLCFLASAAAAATYIIWAAMMSDASFRFLRPQWVRAIESGDVNRVRKELPLDTIDSLTYSEIHNSWRQSITPLMLAAQVDSLPVVIDLLRAGADAAARDRSGNTALIHSARFSSADICELIYAASEITKGECEAAMYYAEVSGNETVIHFFMRKCDGA